MEANIDSTVDIAITRQRNKFNRNKFNPIAKVSEDEPSFVITRHWFKKWKTIRYETGNSSTAYDKFNSIMESLQRCQNIEIDLKRSKVIKTDINPSFAYAYAFKYVVQIFWRNV